MATLRSPGVIVREKDLTNGRASIANANIAAYVAPFPKGELGAPVTIGSEAELISTFGEPSEANAEYWLSAVNYLNYGGTLSVVRVDDTLLKNSVARVGNSVDAVSITNSTTNGKYTSAPSVTFSAPPAGGTTATGTASLDSNGRVVAVTLTNTGSGYQSAPTVTLGPVGLTAIATAAQGSTATAEADGTNLSAGALTGTLTVTDGGTGYSSAPTITVSGGGGDPTGVVTTPTIVNGVITAITITGGTGYTSAPTITIDAPTGLEVTLTSGGTNYDPAATYNVNVSGGVASPTFSGTLTINGSGVATGISVTNFGNYSDFTGLTVVIGAPGVTATATATIAADPIKIANNEVYEASYSGNTNGWIYAARTAGTWGNGIRICTIDAGPQQSLELTPLTGQNAFTEADFAVGDTVAIGSKKGEILDVTTNANGNVLLHVVLLDTANSDAYLPSPSAAQEFAAGDSVTSGSVTTAVLSVANGEAWYASKKLYEGSSVSWNSIAARPRSTQDAIDFYGSDAARDAIHVAVVDTTGSVSGAKDTILESFTYASKARNARGPQGGTNYYKDVVSDSSAYVYVGDTVYEYQERTEAFKPKGSVSYALANGVSYALNGEQYNVGVADLNAGYDLFRQVETVTIDYLLMGPSAGTENDTKAKMSNLASIAAERKDCIAFASPHKGNIISSSGTILQNSDIVSNIKSFFAEAASTSYLVLDSNYKYVYDRWSDRYRYIPCNTDVAGLVASTSINNEPWFSPAGFSRGAIRNVAKLAWNPSKTDRDELYSNRINPIAVFPGQGAVLFGDKTALATPSAFDRINVRKLFLVVEKAIEDAAKAQLFEINDETTRSIFKGIVEPFLRDVQSRRGIYDFLVVCDETNNTPSVIDANEFQAEIYIQPARSINYITLTFVATRTGINFSEIIAR